MEITPAQLKEYTKKANPKRWKCYDDSVALYDALRTHADGEFPHKLIKERRPAESMEIHAYRQKIYEPITEGTFSKILTSLGKIRKASDWGIKYDQTDVPPAIAKEETPEVYFESQFPYFKSLTDWMFNVGLKNYLIDANAVIVVLPLETDLPENTYLRPFPVIFNSNLVYDYEEESFCVLYSTDKANYKVGTTIKNDGDIYYVVTDKVIQRYDQVNAKGDKELVVNYVHNLGYMPAFRAKGIFKKALDKTIMWKSRIASIVPGLNEAVREYSDLQAEVVQHIHSTMWVYATQDCQECKGLGQLPGREGRTVVCEVCKGQGKINTSPYAHQVIRPAQLGEQQVPTPPMGYVSKDTEIVKIQDDRVDAHIYKALSAINMEFLQDTPLSESGTAKEVDRDELNIFVNSVASDIVGIMREIEKIGIDYRYRIIVPNESKRKGLVPTFSVPLKFDLLSSNSMIGDIQDAKTGKVDPSIVTEMEVEFATKRFSGEPDVQALVRLTLLLDPFPEIADDDKMTRMQNGGISKIDYVVSCNIHQFVRRAIDEDEKFVALDYGDQRDVLEKYAQEVIDANDQAAQLKLKMAQKAIGAPVTDPNQDELDNSGNQDQKTGNADDTGPKQKPGIDETPNTDPTNANK
ncbi:MAG TPA: hypothetical protein VFE32_17400 [Puia sp.]|jgi:hypothetical protein|nr:hypothetical protein [Puia sp.]